MPEIGKFHTSDETQACEHHCPTRGVTARLGASPGALAPAAEIETPLSHSLAIRKVQSAFHHCSDYKNTDVNGFKCASVVLKVIHSSSSLLPPQRLFMGVELGLFIVVGFSVGQDGVTGHETVYCICLFINCPPKCD